MFVRNIILFIFISLVAVACLEEDFFGLSSFGRIKDIQVSNQAGPARIDHVNQTVEIEIPAGVSLDQLTVNKLTLSSFATSDIQVGDQLNLEGPAILNVTAEDGTIVSWTIEAFVAASSPQLPNADFEMWYQVNAGYFEPGESESSTIWGTGNPGGALIEKIATTPIDLGIDNKAAHLETLDNGFLGGLVGAPITAATIYTGRFNSDNIDISNPRAAVELGTLFSGRPDAFTLSYKYTPGPENKDKQGNVLPYGDQLDIYLFLEVREGNSARRLATGWFRSDQLVEEMTAIRVNLVYGELDASYPAELLPEDGYVSEDSAGFILPTHLSFLATSSFEGDKFNGAIGSTLIIDDLELIYEE